MMFVAGSSQDHQEETLQMSWLDSDRRSRTMIGKGSGLASILLVGLLIAACGGNATSGTTTSASSGPPDNVTFLTDFLLYGYHAPFFAGRAEGFYRDKNIEITIVAGKGSADGAVKVASGAAQFGQLDAVSALTAISKGANLKLVSVYFEKYPGGLCYVNGRKEIHSYKDIEGAKVGAAAGDAYMVALPGLMQQAGADFSKVKVITMAGAATTPSLLAGQIDVTPCGAPTFATREAPAEKQGLKLGFFSFADNGFSAIGFALVANGDVVRTNPGLVQRFTDAWAKSAVWSVHNPDKAVQDFLNANPDQNATVSKQSFTDVFRYLKDNNGRYFVYDKAVIDSTVAFVNKAYNATVTASQAFTSQFVDKVPDAYKRGQLS
jgi:NitT/TauT family transport system substrate-binding protein